MSQSINRDNLALLLADYNPPCLSLYQPTHRRYPENQQDPIRYKNLLRTLQESLRRQYSTKETSVLVDQFRSLASDSGFWMRIPRDGGFRCCGVVPSYHTSSFSS